MLTRRNACLEMLNSGSVPLGRLEMQVDAYVATHT